MLRRAFIGALVALGVGVATEGRAEASTKVEIVSVVWSDAPPDKARVKQVERSVRRHAAAALKHLKFGTGGKARVTISIRELERAEEAGGVLRISCTLVGKLEGGGSARSKISFGGKPDQKKKLERQVLAAASEGVMVRLAELSKQKQKDADKKAS